MWYGEPHPFPGKKLSYHTERQDNKVTKGDRVYALHQTPILRICKGKS